MIFRFLFWFLSSRGKYDDLRFSCVFKVLGRVRKYEFGDKERDLC